MRVGATVLLLPLLNPVEVAEQVATLDVITEGRFIFGVGLGYRDVENEAFGVAPKERVGRLVEDLEVIRRLWSGEEVTHHGRFFHLTRARMMLRPVQRPHPAGGHVPAAGRGDRQGSARERRSVLPHRAGRGHVTAEGQGDGIANRVESRGLLLGGRWVPGESHSYFDIEGRESRSDILYDWGRRTVQYDFRGETFFLRRVRIAHDVLSISESMRVDDAVSAMLNYREGRWPPQPDGSFLTNVVRRKRQRTSSRARALQLPGGGRSQVRRADGALRPRSVFLLGQAGSPGHDHVRGGRQSRTDDDGDDPGHVRPHGVRQIGRVDLARDASR